MGLLAAAFGQFCLAVLSLNIARILNWKADIAKMPQLIREVFHIHTWFIALTLLIFSTLTWRFAFQMSLGNEDIYRWLACAIGIFWGIRATLQITYYSSSHWRGIPSRTVVHVILLIVYTGWAALYLIAGTAIWK